jgi:hypothetical protein
VAPSRFIAISAYQYQGIDFDDKEFYRSLYRYVPNELVGHSILVFELDAPIPRTRAPFPLRIRQVLGLASGDDPIEATP